MENSQKEMIDILVKNSKLSDADKKLFITFLNNISESNLFKTIQIFGKKPEEIEHFWTALKSKMTFLRKIESSENFSSDKKTKIINQIAKMTNAEFNACVNSIKEIKSETDLKEKIKKFSKYREKSHKEFIILAGEFLRKITHCQSEIQQKKDSQKADEIIQKIKSLKS